MNKTVLGVAMVVVFCITWGVVAGEARQALRQAEQAVEPSQRALEQSRQSFEQSLQALEKAQQAFDQAAQALRQAAPAFDRAVQEVEQAKQALEQATKAVASTDAHYRTQASWGIGAGLLVDVLLLVGVLAWSKITKTR